MTTYDLNTRSQEFLDVGDKDIMQETFTATRMIFQLAAPLWSRILGRNEDSNKKVEDAISELVGDLNEAFLIYRVNDNVEVKVEVEKLPLSYRFNIHGEHKTGFKDFMYFDILTNPLGNRPVKLNFGEPNVEWTLHPINETGSVTGVELIRNNDGHWVTAGREEQMDNNLKSLLKEAAEAYRYKILHCHEFTTRENMTTSEILNVFINGED